MEPSKLNQEGWLEICNLETEILEESFWYVMVRYFVSKEFNDE
jgi:hypothetical protein